MRTWTPSTSCWIGRPRAGRSTETPAAGEPRGQARLGPRRPRGDPRSLAADVRETKPLATPHRDRNRRAASWPYVGAARELPQEQESSITLTDFGRLYSLIFEGRNNF